MLSNITASRSSRRWCITRNLHSGGEHHWKVVVVCTLIQNTITERQEEFKNLFNNTHCRHNLVIRTDWVSGVLVVTFREKLLYCNAVIRLTESFLLLLLIRSNCRNMTCIIKWSEQHSV